MQHSIKTLASDLSIEELPNEGLQIFARVFGMEATIELMEQIPGIRIEVPKSGFLKAKERYIVRHYNGSNGKSIALALRVSESFVQQTVRKKKRVYLDTQENLFPASEE